MGSHHDAEDRVEKGKKSRIEKIETSPHHSDPRLPEHIIKCHNSGFLLCSTAEKDEDRFSHEKTGSSWS